MYNKRVVEYETAEQTNNNNNRFFFLLLKISLMWIRSVLQRKICSLLNIIIKYKINNRL